MIDPRIATVYDADYTGPLFFAQGQNRLVIPYGASDYNTVCCPRQEYGYYPRPEPSPGIKSIPINVYPYYHKLHQNPDGTWPTYRQEPNGTLY